MKKIIFLLSTLLLINQMAHNCSPEEEEKEEELNTSWIENFLALNCERNGTTSDEFLLLPGNEDQITDAEESKNLESDEKDIIQNQERKSDKSKKQPPEKLHKGNKDCFDRLEIESKKKPKKKG